MPSQRSRNPVTLLDYLSFGAGAIGGFFVTHLYHYSDLGHSIPAGGFAAMGASRAFVASSERWFTIRRLKGRAAGIAQRLEDTVGIDVDDLKARLALANRNWDGGHGDFFTDEQFEVALGRVVDDFNKRQFALLKPAKARVLGTGTP